MTSQTLFQTVFFDLGIKLCQTLSFCVILCQPVSTLLKCVYVIVQGNLGDIFASFARLRVQIGAKIFLKSCVFDEIGGLSKIM